MKERIFRPEDPRYANDLLARLKTGTVPPPPDVRKPIPTEGAKVLDGLLEEIRQGVQGALPRLTMMLGEYMDRGFDVFPYARIVIRLVLDQQRPIQKDYGQ